MTVKPISPKDIVEAKLEVIPSEVIEAFNEVIARKWTGHSATIRHDDVIPLILEKLNAADPITPFVRADVFSRNWLEIDDIYRKAGWKVEYDKPGYNENYAATWTFTKK